MLLRDADEDHRLLAAAAAVAVGVLGHVHHEGLDVLDADRSKLVALPVEQVESLIGPEFDLEKKKPGLVSPSALTAVSFESLRAPIIIHQEAQRS